MNDMAKGAYEKVVNRYEDKKVIELMIMAARAAETFGPYSSVACDVRLSLWEYLTSRKYLNKREQRALYFWCAAEPERRDKL